MPSQDVLEAIDSLGATVWEGITYRHTTARRDPLSGAGAYIVGGRWNPPNSFNTIYLADSIDACVAEYQKVAASQPGRATPRLLHTIAVHDLRVLDLRETSELAAVGLKLGDIAGDDRAACQLVGEAAHYLELGGIFAPSATGVGHVLAVFEDRVQAGVLEHVKFEDLPAQFFA